MIIASLCSGWREGQPACRTSHTNDPYRAW